MTLVVVMAVLLLFVGGIVVQTRLLDLSWPHAVRNEIWAWQAAAFMFGLALLFSEPWLRLWAGGTAILAFFGLHAVGCYRHLSPGHWDRACVVLLVATFLPGLFVLFQTCIFHDALKTYGYLRSAILDHDLSFYNEFVLYNARFMYVPLPYDPVFYSGLCLVALPFFVAGHVFALLLGQDLAVFPDGYSWPYLLFTNLSGVFAGLAALLAIFFLCRRYFGPFPSLLASLSVFWAGQLVFYTFVWPLYSHIYSTLIITLFLLHWLRHAENMDTLAWALWGILLGFAIWIRPQTVLFGVIPLAEWLSVLRKRNVPARVMLGRGLVFVAAALLAFSPQMMLWLKTAGLLVVDAYARIGDEFFWLWPRFDSLLFSWNHGLFTWTPIALLALPGLVWLYKRAPRETRLLLLVVLMQLYLIAAYEYPDGGAGFGSRYLCECLPILALGLAALIERLHRFISAPFLVALAWLFMGWNLSLMAVYQLEMIPHNNYTPTFGELFGRAMVDLPNSLELWVTSTQNQAVVFIRCALAAWQQNDPDGLLIVFTGFVVVAFGLVSVATCFFRAIGPRMLPLLLLLFLAIDASILALDRGPRFAHAYPALKTAYDRQEALPAFPEREFYLDPAAPTRMLELPYTNVTDQIDLTTTVIRGEELQPGQALACMEAIDEHGISHVLILHYGVETAEYAAFDGPYPMARASAGIDRERVVHHWLTRTDDGEYYYGSGYHAQLELPGPLHVQRLSFQYLAPAGRLIVNNVWLAQRKAGP